MATKDQVEQAIGCLGVAFPQFVAKELALLTESIVSSVQGFTDPLKSMTELNIAQLLEDVSSLSSGDAFDDMTNAGIGLGAYLAKREIETHLETGAATEFSGDSLFVKFRNGVETGRQGLMLAMSVYRDFPYAAAQKMCETLVELTELKIQNLTCLKRHITQLVNLVLVVVESRANYRDDTLADLDTLATELTEVQTELARSQIITSTSSTFDSDAFTRARQALADAILVIAPQVEEGTSILNVVEILTSDSVTAGQLGRANVIASNLTIPALQHTVSLEASAVVAQIDVINHYVTATLTAINAFSRAGTSSQAVTQRAQLITEMKNRVQEVQNRVNAVRARGSTQAASLEMLWWTAKLKTVQSIAENVKSLTYEAGSIEGPDRALLFANAYEALRSDLIALENDNTTEGLEGYTDFKAQVNGLVSGSERIMKDLADGYADEAALRSFHARAAVIASRQNSFIEDSILLAQAQRDIAETYIGNTGGMIARDQYDQFVDLFRQMGQDRAVDFLNEGKFDELLGAAVDALSYLGLAAQCLTNAISATDDTQTRQTLASIRDDILSRLDNQYLAAADSVDSGVTRIIEQATTKITEVQKHAATVETILEDFKQLGERLEVNVEQALDGYDKLTEDLDRLMVGAGGRLAGDLEEYARKPKSGVPLCFPL